MIKYESLPSGEPLYMFVSDDGTEQINIHSPSLRKYCLERQPPLEIFVTPIQLGIVNRLLREKSVDMNRVFALTEEHLKEPISFCRHTDSLVLLVDGHHRLVRTALDGRQLIKCWVLPPEEWDQFRVIGAPRVTKQTLIDLPLSKR